MDCGEPKVVFVQSSLVLAPYMQMEVAQPSDSDCKSSGIDQKGLSDLAVHCWVLRP